MRNPDRPLSVAAPTLVIGVAITTPAAANPSPNRPNTVVASAARGGLIDFAARTCTSALAAELGQA
jgi:tripartite-type tricarboxylate transporter receptor subunit TctC